MSGQTMRELIQAYLWEPGERRPRDPSSAEERHRRQRGPAFAWGGTPAPFRVVEVEHVCFRERNEKSIPASPKPAHSMRTMIAVRRLTPDQFGAYPEQVAGWTQAQQGSE